MNIIAVYITAKDADEARRLGQLLLEKRLVACVNIVENISSSYLWRGVIQHEQEALLIAKTRQALFPQVKRLVKENHSYDVPCINALPVLDSDESYSKWVYQ